MCLSETGVPLNLLLYHTFPYSNGNFGAKSTIFRYIHIILFVNLFMCTIFYISISMVIYAYYTMTISHQISHDYSRYWSNIKYHRFYWLPPVPLDFSLRAARWLHWGRAWPNCRRKSCLAGRTDLGSLANFFVIQQAHSPLHEPWWDSSFSWLPLFFSRPSSRLELVNCYLIGDLILDDPGS